MTQGKDSSFLIKRDKIGMNQLQRKQLQMNQLKKNNLQWTNFSLNQQQFQLKFARF